MKQRPSHRQLRITRKHRALNERIKAWAILINDPPPATVFLTDKAIDQARVTQLKLGIGRNIPGVPWHLR